MKTPLKLLLLLIAVMLIIPAITATTSPAQTDETPPPPPPEAVSPANPDIDPPAVGTWCCQKCGYENPRAGKRFMKNRPMLAPRNRGTCDMPGQRHAFDRRGRGHRGHDMPGQRHAFDRRGRGHRGHDRPGARGVRKANFATRLLRHAEALELTETQVAKLEKLSYDTQAELIDVNAELQKEKLAMRQLKRDGSDDLMAIKRHLKKMADLRVEMQVEKEALRIEARKILTDEQKEMLKKQRCCTQKGFCK